MPRLLGRRLALGLLVLLSIAPLRAQLTFQFNYSLDSENFFSGDNIGRRQYLEAAGAYVSQYFTATTLSAIAPGVGGNSWDATIYSPANPAAKVSLGNLTVPANTVIVYAGGTTLGGAVLAEAGPGGYDSANGDTIWQNYTVPNRTLSASSLTRSAVGSVSFNSATSWFFDPTPQSNASFADQYDFFTVAAHELLHVLGFGDPRPGSGWNKNLDLFNSGIFVGSKVFETNPDGIPLRKDPIDPLKKGDHWATDTLSFSMRDGTSQQVLMDYDIWTGERKYLTTLDLRAMQDIGYPANFTAVPEPAAFGVGAGVISLVWAWRRRRAQS